MYNMYILITCVLYVRRGRAVLNLSLIKSSPGLFHAKCPEGAVTFESVADGFAFLNCACLISLFGLWKCSVIRAFLMFFYVYLSLIDRFSKCAMTPCLAIFTFSKCAMTPCLAIFTALDEEKFWVLVLVAFLTFLYFPYNWRFHLQAREFKI